MLMNEYDVADAVEKINADVLPNLAKGARVLSRLVDWTNSNSDGWPYWVKPRQASKRLQETVYAASWNEPDDDLTEAELRQVLAPVRAFLTRRGLSVEDKSKIMDDPERVVHSIDVFAAGDQADGTRRYLPACLTCSRAVGPVLENYNIALTLAGEHREFAQ